MRTMFLFISTTLLFVSVVCMVFMSLGFNFLSDANIFLINFFVALLVIFGAFRIFYAFNLQKFSYRSKNKKILILIGFIVLIFIFPCISAAIENFHEIFGVDNSVSSKHWYELDGKHFLVVNKGAPQEISEFYFNELNFKLFQIFSIFWSFASYFSLIIWEVFELKKTKEINAT